MKKKVKKVSKKLAPKKQRKPKKLSKAQVKRQTIYNSFTSRELKERGRYHDAVAQLKKEIVKHTYRKLIANEKLRNKIVEACITMNNLEKDERCDYFRKLAASALLGNEQHIFQFQ